MTHAEIMRDWDRRKKNLRLKVQVVCFLTALYNQYADAGDVEGCGYLSEALTLIGGPRLTQKEIDEVATSIYALFPSWKRRAEKTTHPEEYAGATFIVKLYRQQAMIDLQHMGRIR